MTYLVHGASGAQGGPVASLLRSRGHDVRPLTRALADLADVPALTTAYAGVTGVFAHLPVTGDPAAPARWLKSVASAALAAKPGRVVLSTSGGPDEERLAAFRDLAAELRAGGVPATLLAPRLFKENLLLPPIQERLRAEGVLSYPVRADQPIAWSSHLDVAEAAVAALTLTSAPAEVHLGQPVTGPELAAGFAAHTGRAVRYEALTPAEFQALLAPLLGEGAAAGVADSYRVIETLPALDFPAEQGGPALLGTGIRTTEAWLAELNIPA